MSGNCKHLKLRGFTELDEINEDIDPFAGVEITSGEESSAEDDQSDTMGDGDNQSDATGDGNDQSDITGDGDGRSTATGDGGDHLDCDGDGDITMDNAQLHDILLDPDIDPEDEEIELEDSDAEPEDDGPEDDGAEPEDDDVGSNGDDTDPGDEGQPEDRPSKVGDEELPEFNHGFRGVELGIVPPRPTRSADSRRLIPYAAGCVWVASDWSCPYDAVFMAFWSLYKQSPVDWRDGWKQYAPEWNGPLSNNFDHLILLANTPMSLQNHTEWFSQYRDRFRDQLSHANPRSFPRRGQEVAGADRILGVMFGQDTGAYLEQSLICGDCGVSSQANREICFLAASHGRGNKVPVWLHDVWEEFVCRSKTDAARAAMKCSCCQGLNKVQALKMPAAPWIWFERDRFSPVWPSMTLTFDSPSQQLRYSLRAIIYSGGKHFTARFREQSNKWWKHDGRVASGVPQPDNVRSPTDLLMNGTRFAHLLIYRSDDH